MEKFILEGALQSVLKIVKDQRKVKDNRAVFKWPSKVITRLGLLRLVIGSKISRSYFNQREAKPKPIPLCARDFSRP